MAPTFLPHPVAAALQVLCLVTGGLAVAQAPPPTRIDQGADITTMCGSKPTVVALVDGTGGVTWRRVTRAEFEAEARRCPNVTRVLYAEAGNDQQKYNGAINSLVAQGANIIVTFTDFGDASLPVFRSAVKAGVTMVPYFAKLSGTPGRDYSANLYFDTAAVGKAWADWLGANLTSGNVLFLGGVPGSTTSLAYLNGLKAGLRNHPGLKLLESDYVVTNWNPADAQRAVSGLIAKHRQIDAIVSDYGVEALGAVKAFEQAGLKLPAQATVASFNELNCKYLASRKSAPWKYYSVDGTNRMAGFALRRGMALYQGTKNDEALGVMPYVYADSEKGIDPQCDPKAPPDADFTSGLPRDKLNAVFKQ